MQKFITVADRKFEVVADGSYDDGPTLREAAAYAASLGGVPIKLPAGHIYIAPMPSPGSLILEGRPSPD